MPDAVKIKIKAGAVEIDYEGESEFLKDGLLDIFRELTKFNEHVPQEPAPQQRREEGGGGGVGNHSIVTISTLLKVTTGPDLVMAAAAYLHFSDGKPEFTRSQLLDAMKTATGYWKESYSNNLSQALKGLTKADKLRVVREETYSLPAKESARMEAELAKA